MMTSESQGQPSRPRTDPARVLYLVHDLDDPAVWRRAAMLSGAEAEVEIAGFRRGTGPLPGPAHVLGQTKNAAMAQRAVSVLRQRLRPGPALRALVPPQGPFAPDVILARNLEMLALAVPLRRRLGTRLVYEVLDIHRLMVGPGRAARVLRRVERYLCRDVDRLLVSSPGFLREHFQAYAQCGAPVTLVENKMPMADLSPPMAIKGPTIGPIRIGWFGILRCGFSLACLDAVTRARPGRYRVILRGRPARDALPDFDAVVAANPDLSYDGPYDYPGDLSALYASVDLAWLVDRYDPGGNSDWLLPNRLYESGANGVPPIGLAGTQIAARMQTLDIGLVLDTPDIDAADRMLADLTPDDLTALRARQAAVPRETWIADAAEGRDLLADILGPDATAAAPRVLAPPIVAPPVMAPSAMAPSAMDPSAPDGGVLIVVPTLQEARHIGAVVDSLLPFLRRSKDRGRPARLIVVDGGSTDGTPQIVRDRAAAAPDLDIRVIDNPARLQSAGINLAVRDAGTEMTWLVRLDAHAAYPEDYVDTLLDEAAQSGAASVVVAMNAVGTAPLQRIIATCQNSRLGNGGAAHRTGGPGRYVDHGHHALMRLDAFRDVGGYDGTFSHNEDAELDLRLGQAGHRIWLSTRTGMDYLPRNNAGALIRQYFRFGRGRARTTMKHRIRPRLRQMAMIGLAPAVALIVLAPLHWVFAGPALVWALICLCAGGALALSRRSLSALATGPIAAMMQLAWSAGFWRQVVHR